MLFDLEKFIKKYSDRNNLKPNGGESEISSEDDLYLKKIFIAWKLAKALRILK